MFDTIAEADQKLTNTIIFFDNKPVMVGGARGNDGDVRLKVRPLNKTNWIEWDIGSSRFNMKSLGGKLGYINTRIEGYDCTMYSRRIPVRKAHQTQGLSNANVAIDGSSVMNPYGLNGSHSLFHYENCGLERTLEQVYPNLSTIKSMVNHPTFLEAAFHKYLSVSKDFENLWKLRYKNQIIGWTADLDQFYISKEWDYLGELFEESNLKVRSSNAAKPK